MGIFSFGLSNFVNLSTTFLFNVFLTFYIFFHETRVLTFSILGVNVFTSKIKCLWVPAAKEASAERVFTVDRINKLCNIDLRILQFITKRIPSGRTPWTVLCEQWSREYTEDGNEKNKK